MRFAPLLAVVALTVIACSPDTRESSKPVKVEVVKTDAGYRLLRGGVPYAIKGAGMAIDDIEAFAAHGGNTIRNWSTTAAYQDTRKLLDSAHAHGVTVALCLPMQAERWGFDYDDDDVVAAQLAEFREQVLEYRDHPALLVWIIGNEVNHSYTNPKVFDAVNDVARMIRQLDGNHPTTTALSGFEAETIAAVRVRAPALDFLSFQTYGSLFGLPDKLSASGFDAPFMVTEWGTLGYWDMEQTAWGAPIELTSSEKAEVILRAHREVLEALEHQLLGSYVFFWGQKQERTPTWFGLLTERGEETEAVDVMHYIWNGAWPANRAPRVEAMRLDNRSARDNIHLVAGEKYDAVFEVIDYEDDPLRYHWEIKPESEATQVGGDFENRIASLEGVIENSTAASTSITAPAPGAYRLFAYAYDGQGHAAHANIPLMVRGASGKREAVREVSQQATAARPRSGQN